MKNSERYKETLENFGAGELFCQEFAIPIIFGGNDKRCVKRNCDACQLLQYMWMNEEYTEPTKPETEKAGQFAPFKGVDEYKPIPINEGIIWILASGDFTFGMRYSIFSNSFTLAEIRRKVEDSGYELDSDAVIIAIAESPSSGTVYRYNNLANDKWEICGKTNGYEYGEDKDDELPMSLRNYQMLDSISRRLNHLLRSDYIAKFDEVNPFTGEYILPIEQAGKFAEAEENGND